MLCLLSARRLKPGAFDQFRRAWEPPSDDVYPPGFRRAYHVRNVRDEDEIVSFGLFDTSLEELRAWRAEHEDEELKRQDAMAAFVENVHVEGIYELVEEVGPSS
jgi:heme-degrading monooxygenase HmoA